MVPLVKGKSTTQAGPSLEDESAAIDLERAEGIGLSAEQNLDVWHRWVAAGPMGPIADAVEPESGSLPTLARDANDTHPRIEQLQIEGYRRMTPAQKLAIVSRLTSAIHELALMDIRRRHPGAGEREQRLRLASRFYDAATMRRVFDWDPDVMGY
jgi:hypothetical protein